MRAANNILPETIGTREVMALAWPVIVQMLAFNAMLVADAIFVGQLGTTQLAAVGLAGTAFFLLRAFGNGLLGGVRVATAQATGAGEHRRAMSFAWQGLFLALVVGVPVAFAGPIGPWLFRVLGASPGVEGYASAYFDALVYGAPFGCLNMAIGAWFQGRGDTRTPMVGSVGANLLNIVLDAVLIFGLGPIPALGVAGAAWATTISRISNTLFMSWRLSRAIRGHRPVLVRAQLREVWRLGSPLGVQWLLDVGSYTVIAGVLASVGEAHLAAHVVCVRIICISFLPGYAIGEAAGVLVGHAVGAGRHDLAYQAWTAATRIAVGIMVGCAVVFLAVPGPLLGVFGAEAEVVALARQLLVIAALFQVFDAIATVANGAIVGAGDTRFTLVASLASAWLIKVPLGVVLALTFGMGAVGAWLGFFGEILFFAMLCLWRIQSGRWLGVEADVRLAPSPAK